MVIGLTRKGPKLLSVVRGKRHANDDDHEEPLSHKHKSSPRSNTQEEDIYAEPAPSDDDIRPPPPRAATSKSKISLPQSSNASEELKQPQKKVNKKQVLRVPRNGQFEKSQRGKGLRGGDNKENASTTVSSSAGSEVNAWGFDVDDADLVAPPAKKQKTTFGSSGRSKVTTNIHVASSARGMTKSSQTYGRKKDLLKDIEPESETEQEKELLNSDDEKELFPSQSNHPDTELRKIVSKPKKIQTLQKDSDLKQPTLSDAELDAFLEEDITSRNTSTKRSSQFSRNTRLLNQLKDWEADLAPNFSEPTSSAPVEALSNIDSYLDELPEELPEDTICSICKAPVSPEEYWTFWKGQDRTIKKQNAFCLSHRRTAAQDEYRAEGYPISLDWAKLPERIRKHRMELFKILNGDINTPHRQRYEPLALTGKAASAPKKLNHLPTHLRDTLTSHTLDDVAALYPGYYGPHGRRIIVESVMKMLKNEIKNCTDRVVQASGPAAFVQAVLVPEVAVRLIMGDMCVDREEAEEIRERTVEMGGLLNEEVEDVVVGGWEEEHGEESGNEYGAE